MKITLVDLFSLVAYGLITLKPFKLSCHFAIELIVTVLIILRSPERLVFRNSEQRFLDYKSVALNNERFFKFLEKPTAIVDVGGGSIQISLFENDTLVTTQQLRLGVLRLHSTMQLIQPGHSKYPMLVQELVESQLNVFAKMHLKDRKVEYNDWTMKTLRKKYVIKVN